MSNSIARLAGAALAAIITLGLSSPSFAGGGDIQIETPSNSASAFSSIVNPDGSVSSSGSFATNNGGNPVAIANPEGAVALSDANPLLNVLVPMLQTNDSMTTQPVEAK